MVEHLFGSTSLAACILDRDLRIVRANAAAAAIFDRSSIVGESASALAPGAGEELRRCFILAEAGTALPDRHFTANGRNYAVTLHPGSEGSELLVLATDVTRRLAFEQALRASRRRLMAVAQRDHLTGLLNRRGLETALHREIRRARRAGESLSLLLIDIDWFKAYNDSLGHQQGDRCLQMVAEALAGCLRRATDAACRYGGEEFVLILPATDAAGAGAVAANCRQAIEALEIIHPASPQARITASIGIVEAPRSEVSRHVRDEAQTLLAQADRALYRAKQNGRDRIEIA